jgi:hypothetical protein
MDTTPKFGSYYFTDSNGLQNLADIFQVAGHQPAPAIAVASVASNEKTSLVTAFTNKIKGFLDPLFPSGTPSKVLWNAFQTPIKNQKDRDTCSCFAMVAAIEARYKRDLALDLDLSEQFYWHMYKSSSLDYPRKYYYENQSSYWGGGNSGGVTSAINFAIPLETDCGYLDGGGMNALRISIPAAGDLNWQGDPAANNVTQLEVDSFEYSQKYIADGARQNAKYGIQGYHLLSSNEWQTPSNLENYIASGHEIIIDLDLYTKTDANGIWQYDQTAGGGSHCVLLVGYDRDAKVFYIKNSWGASDFDRISYDCATRCFKGGSIVTGVRHPESPCLKGKAVGYWHADLDGRPSTLIIRRYTNENNSQTRLGHFYDADWTPHAVNGTFVDGDRGISVVTQDGNDPDPNSTQGQNYAIDFFSSDITQGAGFTTWEGKDYGVYVATNQFSVIPANSFDPSKWKGVWHMDHDGWQGVLNIEQITNVPPFLTVVTGTYQQDGGPVIPFTGSLKNGSPHILQFNINFAQDNIQPFTLHYFTWSNNRAAGYNIWSGGRYGAVAYTGIPIVFVNPREAEIIKR